MDSVVDLIYQCLQETDIIQEGREKSQKEVERIVEEVRINKQVLPEDVSDLLYGLVLIAEREGFRAGVMVGNKLKEELEL